MDRYASPLVSHDQFVVTQGPIAHREMKIREAPRMTEFRKKILSLAAWRCQNIEGRKRKSISIDSNNIDGETMFRWSSYDAIIFL